MEKWVKIDLLVRIILATFDLLLERPDMITSVTLTNMESRQWELLNDDRCR